MPRYVVSLAEGFFVDGGNRGGDAGDAELGLSFHYAISKRRIVGA